MIMIEF